MGTKEATQEYLEKRLEIAKKELGEPILTGGLNFEDREENMFWKGASAALDLTKAIDGVA